MHLASFSTNVQISAFPQPGTCVYTPAHPNRVKGRPKSTGQQILAPGYPTLLQEKAPTVQLQGSWILSNLPTSLPLEAIVTFQ
jgi:hypothetical protein